MTGRSYACSTLQEELRDEGLLFVGVSPDEGGFGTVRPFAREYSINYRLVLGDQLLVEQSAE